ncbi:LPS export ABC transporter permease LptG [Methylococcaceae bacterium]|nr:LPS export ABC transporter permease LptG [Methylococcaceae bacterium]
MSILTKYIVNEILKGAFIALILLLTLFNLFTLADELKDLKGAYNLTEIFIYLALTSPRVCYELVPAAALLGSLFVLGAMGNNRELTAMRAAGVSVLGIIKSVLIAGAILATFSIGIGELIAPITETKAQILRSSAQDKKLVSNSKYGLWLREGDKFINVRKLENNGEIADISIYEYNQTHLKMVTHAEKAVYLDQKNWRLENITQSQISIDKMQVNVKNTQSWKSTIAPDLVKISVVNPDNLSLIDLSQYIKFLKSNQQKSQTFELAFWGRVVNPFVTFVMLLVATPFVIGVKRGVNVGSRMMIGIVIGMSFNILDKIFGHVGLIYDFNPLLMAISPSLFVSGVSVYVLRRLV